MIRITLDRPGRDALRLVKEWPKRTEFATSVVLHSWAKQVRDRVEADTPSTDQWKEYRASIEVASIKGLPKGAFGVAVHARAGSRKVKPENEAIHVLYVVPKRRFRKRNAVSVLQRHSPWTLETLPFVPSRKDAKVVSRKVRRREAVSIAAKRKADKNKWQAELRHLGVRLSDQKVVEVDTTQDLSFEVLRAELFSTGTSVWKPILREFNTARALGRMFNKNTQFVKALTEPNWRGWRKTPVLPGEISVGEAEEFGKFQIRLGYGGRP